MINNGSEVSVTGAFEVITGDQSWYAVNVDNKAGNASITFEEDSTLKFEDKSSAGDKTLIYAQNTNTAVAATIEYGEAVVSIPDGRVKFDAESHVLTVVEGGDLELMKEITVTIPVKYVYTFGERTAQIVVNVTK